MLPEPEPLPPAPPADRVAVVSGSCSPVTARQIEWALANGFGGVRLDPGRLAVPETAGAEHVHALVAARAHMSEGRGVVAYTAMGPEDPAVAGFEGALAALAIDRGTGGARVGTALGRLLRDLLIETETRRAVIAGGDTAGYGCNALGLDAVTMLTPIAPGSPLCRAMAPDAALDGLEIALKGGQVGGPDYFGAVRRGAA